MSKSIYGEQVILEILAEQRTALLTKLRDEVEGLGGKRTSVNFDGYELALTTETYEESPLILRSEVLALLEKAGE